MLVVAFPTLFEAEEFLVAIGKPHRQTSEGLEFYKGALGETPIVVPILGIGQKLATESSRKILTLFNPSLLIVAGFAGALEPKLALGQVVIASDFTHPDLLQSMKLVSGYDIVRMYTSPTVASGAAAKARLAAETKCHAIDMETAFVFEEVSQQGIPLMAIRVISDEAHEDLPSAALAHGYNYKKGKPTPVRLALYLATHPFQTPALLRFVKKLPPVRRKLTKLLVELIPELP